LNRNPPRSTKIQVQKQGVQPAGLKVKRSTGKSLFMRINSQKEKELSQMILTITREEYPKKPKTFDMLIHLIVIMS